jgi:peptide/nickel transport system ATP-binding protein
MTVHTVDRTAAAGEETAASPGPPAETSPTTVLRVEDLTIGFHRDGTTTPVVRGVSFALDRGRCLAVVGESGSGKSVTARTLVGLTGAGAHVRAERLELHGRDLRGLPERAWRRIRGREVGLVLQDALVALDPLRTVGDEVAEPLRVHRLGDAAARRRRVLDVLAEVGVPDPGLRARQRSGELSGGLRQRALIATALAADPPLVVADEPTTALDATVQAQVLDLLAAAKRRGTAVLLISHDLSVVARLADEVCVMRDGEVVEAGPVQDVLREPRHPYTRALVAAVPAPGSRGTRLSPSSPAVPPHAAATGRGVVLPVDGIIDRPVLEASDLFKRYRGPDGVDRTVVDGVSFSLAAGRTLGVVGESGSGKTTTARMALALLTPDRGEVRLHGRPWTATTPRERRALRRRIGVVYQDPLSSFDPRWDVGRILADALATAPDGGGHDPRRSAVELLELVGLGEEHLRRSPLRMSGGQRQRVAIARALAPRPDVVVCDEPVSALDVSVQAQVLDLLTDLQSTLGVAYLFISHDLGVIQHMSDGLLVMKDGRVVEEGPTDRVLDDPQADYTRRLLTAMPRLPVPTTSTTSRSTS